MSGWYHKCIWLSHAFRLLHCSDYLLSTELSPQYDISLRTHVYRWVFLIIFPVQINDFSVHDAMYVFQFATMHLAKTQVITTHFQCSFKYGGIIPSWEHKIYTYCLKKRTIHSPFKVTRFAFFAIRCSVKNTEEWGNIFLTKITQHYQQIYRINNKINEVISFLRSRWLPCIQPWSLDSIHCKMVPAMRDFTKVRTVRTPILTGESHHNFTPAQHHAPNQYQGVPALHLETWL